jgi:tetratricopeptide (TPR) repeat protein
VTENSVTEQGDHVGEGAGSGTRDDLDDLDRLLLEASGHERLMLLRDHLARGVGDGSLGWVGELSVRAARHELSLAELRSLATDVAWLSREAGEEYPSRGGRSVRQAEPRDRLHALVVAYVLGQRLRFDFKFDALGSLAQEWLGEFEGDALVLSFAAFAALGLRAPHGLDLYRQATAAPDADRRSRHVCLAGMWLADHVEGQPEMLLELSNKMMAKGEIDENVFYRRASALRKLGKHDQALDEIDRAISMLGVGNNRVHQDYMRERESILVTMQMQRHADALAEKIGAELREQADKRIEEASVVLRGRVETAQRFVSDSMLKIVEILGLFVTLAGFLIGSGAVVFRASTFTERVVAMIIVVAGSLLFFILLRLVTSFRRK